MQSIVPEPVRSTPLYDREQEIVADVQAHVPMSIQMVENAIVVLSKGWDEMSLEERMLFTDIYDPGDSGDIDDEYLTKVIENYEKILARLKNDIRVEFVTDNEQCTGMRLFTTDFRKIYVCPYYREEESANRKARVLIHEIAHQALWVVDRPYYDPKSYSSSYNALNTKGSWVTEIPVIGHIIREIAHSDTLYHPDAYAWFASEVSY